MFSLVWLKIYQNWFFGTIQFIGSIASQVQHLTQLMILTYRYLYSQLTYAFFTTVNHLSGPLTWLPQPEVPFTPDKCKIALTNWNNISTNHSWWWTRPFPHNNPLHAFIYAQLSSLPILFLLPASHVQCTWIDSSLA